MIMDTKNVVSKSKIALMGIDLLANMVIFIKVGGKDGHGPHNRMN